MKNTVYYFLLVIVLFNFSCTREQSNVSKEKQLKVIAWNIWHGGHAEKYPDQGCDGIIGILKESQADVILMIETYGASDKVADALGYYHRLISSNLSIYSRYPIVKTYTYPDSISTFNFGGAELDIDGQRVRVFDTWLHYLPDARLVPTTETEDAILAWEKAGTRDDEIKAILHAIEPLIKEANSIPIIMGGDFNIHSHLDWTEAAKDMYHHGGTVVDWPVSKIIEKEGFKDSFREIHPDPVANIGVSWLYDLEDKPTRFDRIDYIYYMGEKIRVKDSEVYNGILGEQINYRGKDFFYASDHGFVETTFTISR